MQEHLLPVAGMLARRSRMRSRKAGESCDGTFEAYLNGASSVASPRRPAWVQEPLI
jgi:hypothetical protein